MEENDKIINPWENLAYDKNRLVELFKKYAYQTGEFVLTSGAVSSYYINSKSVMLLPEGAFLVARGILDKAGHEPVDAIGGAALGGAPMAGSLAVLCHLDKRFSNVTLFVDRKAPKKHGDLKRIEGPEITGGSRVLVIDDVATTGQSAMSTVEELASYGCKIVKVVFLLDRKMGARELFVKKGIPFDALLNIEEITGE